MDKQHVNLINDNMSELVQKTHNIEQIVEKLLAQRILNHYMARYILNHPDERGRALELYEMITCRGPKAFMTLIFILRETQNDEAEAILSSWKVSTFVTPAPDEKKSSIPPAKDKDDSVDFCKVEDLVVKIDPEKKFMDIVEKSPCETYKMRSKPRGLALIINIFKSPDPKKIRLGSKLDAEKVKKLFTDIGYKVFPYTDLKRKEMKQQIKAFSMNKELLNVDSLVVFIMCHGKQYQDTEDILLAAADGETLRARWVLQQFTDANPSFVQFKKKPKLFFFQACRVVSQDTSDMFRDMEITRDKSPANSGNVEDTIVVYSTCAGTYSKRDIHEGSWFVNAFCHVVAEHAWQYDLNTMLHSVNKEVLKKKDPIYGIQSMEVKEQGVKGKIYFNPGL
ncbi:caspase Dronc-like [Planococcus citri]|uniref:caspase Dronc-like n=1 Tax=Planococcus citri TaxID=170843 RepID=UPI0031F936D7